MMDKGMLEADPLEPPSTRPLLDAAFSEAVPHPEKEVYRRKKSLKVIPLKRNSNLPRFRCSTNTLSFRKRFYPDLPTTSWNDWRWQLKNRIRDMETLRRLLVLSEDELMALSDPDGHFPFAVTPYYASLLSREDPNQSIRRAVVPVMAERVLSAGEAEDPLGEEHDSPVPGLVHRYPDRVLFLVLDYCATYCRYCTRSRMVGHGIGTGPKRRRWEKAIDYIAGTPSVRDVLLSGGDPLTLSDENLEWLISRLRGIRHVELIRVGTKAPVVLPQRVTPALVQMLKKYHPLWMSIHFTHPEELTPETNQACERLANGGIPLGSQTVLLAGINDTVEAIKRLVHGLIKIRVKPYYLYQCDPIKGSAHVRTSVEKGLEIIKGLRGHTTGYAVPTYVIDAPGGGGKIPLLPDYVEGREGDDLLLRNYLGHIYRYPDPNGCTGDRLCVQ